VEFITGMSVVKADGFYRTLEYPDDEVIASAQEVYLGGHVYEIDTTIADALTAAGYGAYIQDA
jgi:hypothetical protein